MVGKKDVVGKRCRMGLVTTFKETFAYELISDVTISSGTINQISAIERDR